MELVLPLAIFAFALYILGAGRRSRVPTADTAGPGGWSLDYSPGGRRVGEFDLEDLKSAFSRFAAEREGRRLDRAPYEGPRVAYTHRATRAVLGLHIVAREDGPEERFTQIAYAVPAGWRHRIEIGPSSPDELVDSPVPGLYRVSTGEMEFDRWTRVLASEALVARTILDPATRQAITDLRELLTNGHIHLSASASRILVRKRGIVGHAPDLALFARLCDSVYDRLLGVWEREIGIEIIEAPAGPEEDAVRCQVCSHPITAERRVRCRRCRTPHHPDCWEFNGGCATYACGEKDALKGAA
jgi:hypothetical protein